MKGVLLILQALLLAAAAACAGGGIGRDGYSAMKDTFLSAKRSALKPR